MPEPCLRPAAVRAARGAPLPALAERIAERRRGVGDPHALIGEMRRSVLLVPTAGGGLWSARSGGVRWSCDFTDESALARFALQHGSGDQPMDYAALLGARIVDEIVPFLDEPAGLAVDTGEAQEERDDGR